jgi:hypothetical protein
LMEADLSPLRLEGFGGEWHYEIPPQLGRLHVQAQHGRLATPDVQEVLTLTLTARGPAGSGGKQSLDLDAGLNRGHAAVVQAFKALTSKGAHEYWGLTHDNSGT